MFVVAPPHLALVREVEALPVVVGLPEQLARQLEYLEQLRVPEGGCDLAVGGEGAGGVGLADLVHLARELGQQLDADHAVVGAALKGRDTMTFVPHQKALVSKVLS